MELDELMRFARNYVKVGWAVQEQLDDVIRGDYSDINPNALTEIAQLFRGFNDDLDSAINDALAAITETAL